MYWHTGDIAWAISRMKVHKSAPCMVFTDISMRATLWLIAKKI